LSWPVRTGRVLQKRDLILLPNLDDRFDDPPGLPGMNEEGGAAL
jgi:hypothetical protein